MKRLFLLSIFISTVLLNSSIQAKEVRMAIGEWAPFTSEKMSSHGAVAEVVAATFKEMGMRHKFVFESWEACFEQVKSGEAFASFPYVKTPDRAKHADFSDPIFISQTVFFYNKKKNKNIKYKKLSDLTGYRIGGIKGYFYEDIFKKANLRVTYVDSETELLELLHAQKIDLMPENDLVGWSLIKKKYPSQRSNFATLKKRLKVVPNYLLVSRKYPGGKDLLEQFNIALKTIRENGMYYNIMDKYYP